MDENLKTRVIAALRESARCARSPEQQAEALALVEALAVDMMTPNVVIDLGGAGDGHVAHDAPRAEAQATAAEAEQAAYARANAPSEPSES